MAGISGENIVLEIKLMRNSQDTKRTIPNLPLRGLGIGHASVRLFSMNDFI
jgi:hypothetical protein